MRKLTFGKVISYVLLVSLAAIALYLLLQVIVLTNPSYTYETVISYTYTDSITVEGYVLFEETVVTRAGSDDIGFLVEDGARVSAQQAVAEYYTSDTQQTLRAQIEQTNDEIALLEASENTAGALVGNLLSQRSTALYALIEQLDQGDYTSTQANESSFLIAQNKVQVITGSQIDYTARIETLIAQSLSLSEALGELEEITSPIGGYFISKNTAAFLSYDMQTLLALSVEEFAETLAQDNTLASDGFAGKVVSSYTWHFVGLCTTEQSARFSAGDTLEITFPDKSDAVYPASVVSVELDEASGQARVTLSCEYIDADALALGQETAQIIFDTYEGLRVPSDAVRMQLTTLDDGSQDYVQGVFVAYNGLAKFRKIEILYQTDGYILVPLESATSISEVRMYDQVIISGTDLTDGKVL